MSESPQSPKQPGPSSGKLRALFLKVVGLPPENRKAFLDQVCDADSELRLRLEQLLDESNSRPRSNDLLRDAIEQAELTRHAVSEEDVQKALQDAMDVEGLASTSHAEIDNFTIKEVLGGGGMGIVYVAQQHEPLSREVAVKVMKPGLDSLQFLRRFRIEQAALAAMRHPSIVAVLEAGLTRSGHPFFAMELIDGQPIDVFCESQGLTWRERLPLVAETCRAIHHAHEQGILHRDLKPSNVMVATVDGKPAIRVIDFGIAKALSNETLTETSLSLMAHFVGTPHYVSPEQMAFDSVQLGPRSDVYSLGVLLFETLTGTTPLQNHKDYTAAVAGSEKLPLDGVRRLLEDLPKELPSQLCCEWRLPREIDWIVQKTLAFDPLERYSSAEELAAELDRLLAGEPIKTHPPTRIFRVRKWLQKHQQLSKAVLLVIAGIALGSLLVFVASFDESNRSLPRQETTGTIDPPTADLAVESTRSADLMEAAVLTQMLASIDNGRYDELRSFQLPVDADGRYYTSSNAKDLTPAERYGFREFLKGLAYPEPLRTFKHPEAVWRIAISPDRSKLATACEDAWVRVWDVETGIESKRYGPLSWQATAVAYSPDGELLAAGDRDGHVTLWDTSTGQQVARSEELDGGVESLAWSPDGMSLAAGIRYQFVLLLNRQGQPLVQLAQPGPKPPRYETIRFSHDSNRLYAPNALGSITVWDLNSYQPTGELAEQRQLMRHAFAALDDSATRWLVGSRGRDRLEVISANQFDQSDDYVEIDSYPVSMARSPDGQYVATATRNGVLMLWRSVEDDWSDFDAECWMLEEETESITDVVWLSDQALVTASRGGDVKHWTIDRLRRLQGYDAKLGQIFVVTPEMIACRDAGAGDTEPESSRGDVRLYHVREMQALRGFPEPLAKIPKLNDDLKHLYDRMRPNHGASRTFAIVHADYIGFYNISDGKETARFGFAKLQESYPEFRLELFEVVGGAWSRDAMQYAFLMGEKSSETIKNALNHLFIIEFSSNKFDENAFEVRHLRLPRCRKTLQFFGESNQVALCVQNEPEDQELRLYDARRNAYEVIYSEEEWFDFCFSCDTRYLGIASTRNQLVDRETGERFELDSLPLDYLQFFDGGRLLVTVGQDCLSLFHVPSRLRLGKYRFKHREVIGLHTRLALSLQGRLFPCVPTTAYRHRLVTVGQ